VIYLALGTFFALGFYVGVAFTLYMQSKGRI
jgi:hypothetical protein